jgi:hypothetical protein
LQWRNNIKTVLCSNEYCAECHQKWDSPHKAERAKITIIDNFFGKIYCSDKCQSFANKQLMFKEQDDYYARIQAESVKPLIERNKKMFDMMHALIHKIEKILDAAEGKK